MTAQPRGAMFLGQPSPSLKRMRKMNSEELSAHIRRLSAEADLIRHKVRRLQTTPDVPADKIQQLENLERRVRALASEGRRIYRLT